MPNYKLTYFAIAGLGEPIRFILHQSGIEFEDHRITTEEWKKLKPEMPMGQVPVLEIDGKRYYQSKAISRLLAKRNNLYGSDDEEAYQIDATIDTLEDLRLAFVPYFSEEDAKRKEALKAAAVEKLPFYLKKFDEQVKNNGGYFVGGKLSWPDLLYTVNTEFMTTFLGSDVNKDYPELKKLVEKVRSLPKIKAYLDNRPKDMY